VPRYNPAFWAPFHHGNGGARNEIALRVKALLGVLWVEAPISLYSSH